MEEWLDTLPSKARAKCLYSMRRDPAVFEDHSRYTSKLVSRRYDIARPSRFQSETLQYFWDRYIGEEPERIAEYEQARH